MPEFHEILQHYPPNCQPTRIEPLGNAGGLSGAQFWRLATSCGELALRRWPTEHPTPERLRFIHTVLAHAASRGITFLPIPLTTRAGQSFVENNGYLWQMEPWMPGSANYATKPSPGKLRAAMMTLAEFHLAVSDFAHASVTNLSIGSPAIASRIARLRELAEGGQIALASAITDAIWPDFAQLARRFLTVLPRALPRALALHSPLASLSFSLQPCLRDVWQDHVLFLGDHVTGIIDFGAMDIDTPACDVARLLGGLVGDDDANRQLGLTAYNGVRQLTANELQAVAAFDTSIVLLAGCNWIRWIYLEGRQFENPLQILQYFRRIIERTRSIASAHGSG